MSHEPKPSEHAMLTAASISSYLLVGMHHSTKEGQAEIAHQIQEHAIAPAVAERDRRIAEFLKDKERLDWLERNLMSLFHDRSSVSMDGMRVQGQLYNEARGTRGGPSFFRVYHRTIRDALDAARAQQKDTP